MCKHSPGKPSRHHGFDDIVAQAFPYEEMHAVKKPNGLTRLDEKRHNI